MFNEDAAQWHHITWVVLSLCMFFGGCAGSTAGGFKCARGVIALKVLRNEFRHILHPNAVLPVKLSGQSIPQNRLTTLLAFFTLYILALLLVATIMIVSGIDITNSFTIALSLISNVGAGLDTNMGPQMSWADLSDGIKWLCSFLMLVGRLEIVAVLVLFTRAFWKEN